jgi:hypothetical protein
MVCTLTSFVLVSGFACLKCLRDREAAYLKIGEFDTISWYS